MGSPGENILLSFLMRLPTRQDVVENRDKAYTFAINALFIYTRVLSCMRLLLSPGRAI